jgi:histidine triad (HIT) family protein
MSFKECIFCKIVNKEIPSKIIFENEKCMAFLDISPISEGHTIVIPKNHSSTIEDILEDDFFAVFKVVKDLSIHIHKQLNTGGYNVLQNNFKPAGQVIDHFHVHIIPRNEGDNRFKLRLPREQVSENELDKVFKELKI